MSFKNSHCERSKDGLRKYTEKGGRGEKEDIFEALGKKSRKTTEQRRIGCIIDCLDVPHVKGKKRGKRCLLMQVQ